MTIIVVDGKNYQTSLEPAEQQAGGGQHDHTELVMDDSKIHDGQLHLKANPPPNGKYIWIQKGTEDVFKVETDGVVECEALKSTTGVETVDDGAMAHVYSNSTGILRLGRQQNAGESTVGLLDGIHHQRTIDSNIEEFRQQLHPSQPKISITGTTDSGVDWINVKDRLTDNTIFSVHDDGTIETQAWGSVDLSHPDSYADAVAIQGNSLYVGKCKISQVSGQLQVTHLKEPPYIPLRLTQGPYSFTANNINVNTSRSINDWMVLARSYLVGIAQKTLRIRDVFTTQNASQDFELSTGFVDHSVAKKKMNLDAIVVTDYITAKSVMASDNSLWLGERLHVSTNGGKALLLNRKENIPKYLVDLGVVEADVLAIPSTLATLTVQQCVDLSVANSGSDDRSVIFPYANVEDDFTLASNFNEIRVTPINNSEDSGIEINKAAGSGHPIINFVGNSGVGNGYGMLQFKDQNDSAKSILYSSRADGDFHIDQQSGGLQIMGDKLALDAGCNITVGGTAISEATELVYVDSSYTGDSDGSALFPYSNLNTALTAKLINDSTTHYVFKVAPGLYTGGIDIVHTTPRTQSFKIQGSGQNTIIQSGATFAAGKDTSVLSFRRFKTVELSSCTIQNGLYGFYPRDCSKIMCTDVKFQFLGSAGTVNRHNLTGTKAEQATFWASTSTSSGGACRIRACDGLTLTDCEVEYCARGLRLQDVGSSETSSLVSNCRVFRTLESGIYLAAGGYTGATGCENVTVTGCYVYECFNNGLLCIGGKKNTFQGNTVVRSASAGIQAWHSLDLSIIDNNLFDCNLLAWNGVGNDGDAFGQIVIDGNSAIGTGTYMAVIQGNQITKGNQGRHISSVVGINVQNGAYPAASNKFIAENNSMVDCAVQIQNDNSIPQTALAATGGFTSPATLTTATGTTSLTLQSTHATDPKVKFTLATLDPNPGTFDSIESEFIFENPTYWEMAFRCIKWQDHQNSSDWDAFRVNRSGQIVFTGYNIPKTEAGGANFWVKGDARFDHSKFRMSSLPASSSGLGLGELYVNKANLEITNDYSPESLWINTHTMTDSTNTSRNLAGVASTEANWYRLAAKRDIEMTVTGLMDTAELTYKFMFVLPTPTEGGQVIRIEKYNQSYIAFRMLTNSAFRLNSGSGYSVSGTSVLKIDGDTNRNGRETVTLRCLASGGSPAFHWVSSHGDFVNLNTL